MTAQCCLQTFCEECITNWLKNNTTCPYDRKTLTPKDLSRPPRVLMNMLGKLKIRCDFKDKGCKEVVNLEDLTQHAVKCKYNVETKSGHDCIKSLLELNRKANEEINALKRNPLPTSPPIRQPAPAPPPVAAVPARPDLSNSPVIRPTSAVSATNNQRLSQSDPKPPITSSPESSRSIKHNSYFNAQSLKHRFKNGKIKREIQILRTDMKQSMISDVKKITFAAIEKSDTLAAISTEIKTQMEKRYPEHMWQCFIHCYFGVFRIHHTCGTFISFEVGGQLTVTLFQSNTS
ncbi:unnamed protein product [Oppiella nova]|uniref:RING-type domain-containing protein n=1 Tax=Oppiella nova TaxID=334625 RepID=A0A7R9M3B8_9ACAR|nr:unnamed protein product [Oppiella nova]CAG2170008.1 unnamed protein product [Oppiella nova]